MKFRLKLRRRLKVVKMEDGNVTKATVQALIAKRDQMDKDLNALHQTLKAVSQIYPK